MNNLHEINGVDEKGRPFVAALTTEEAILLVRYSKRQVSRGQIETILWGTFNDGDRLLAEDLEALAEVVGVSNDTDSDDIEC